MCSRDSTQPSSDTTANTLRAQQRLILVGSKNRPAKKRSIRLVAKLGPSSRGVPPSPSTRYGKQLFYRVPPQTPSPLRGRQPRRCCFSAHARSPPMHTGTGTHTHTHTHTHTYNSPAVQQLRSVAKSRPDGGSTLAGIKKRASIGTRGGGAHQLEQDSKVIVILYHGEVHALPLTGVRLASLSPLQPTVVTSVEAAIQAIQAIQNLIAEVQSLSELDESHASAVSAFLQDAVGVLRQSLAGREQQEEGEDTADDDRTAGRGSSRFAARGGGRKRRREEDEEDEGEGEEVGREEVRPSRNRRPSRPPPPTGGSSTGSPHPPPTSSRRSGPKPRPESGLSRQYTRQEGGMTELLWVPSSCRYADAVAGERRGEQIGQSCEESLLYAKRVHEIILANPESPLHRLERLLD